MKLWVGIILFGLRLANADKGHSNPLEKVVQLISNLQKTVEAEAEVAEKSYGKFSDWCEETAKSDNYAAKTAAVKQKRLKAMIAEFESDIVVGNAKIEDLTSTIATAVSDQKKAAAIRSREAVDFRAGEKELMSVLATLERAGAVLEREIAKGGSAALVQTDAVSMENLMHSLGLVIDAAAFSSNDRSMLSALLQQHEDDADALGAPSAAKYSRKSGNILEMLEDLKEKASVQLSELREAEKKASHSYGVLAQGLEDKIKSSGTDLKDEKAGVSSAQEKKAIAERDVAVTIKNLKSLQESLANLRMDCMRTAADYEATKAGSKEEMRVLEQAKKILKDATGGAAKQAYSLLQMKTSSKALEKAIEVVNLVKKLAKAQHSASLAQLASRISATLRFGTVAGEDPYAKVKELIQGMLAKLTQEMGTDATKKAYCDEQLEDANVKKEGLNDDVEKLSSAIEQASARLAQLKAESVDLQSELASLTKEQAEADKIRQERKANYVKAQTDLSMGLAGVRKALGVIRDYYGGASAAAFLQDDEASFEFMQQPSPPEKHKKASGAGGKLVDILEVIESDLASELAKVDTAESDEVASYEKVKQENTILKEMKEKDLKFKSVEIASLGKSMTHLSGDRNLDLKELSAVIQYDAKLKETCIGKPEAYKERKAKRDAEIKGLKEALPVLDAKNAFLQRRHRRSTKRFMGIQ